MMPARGGTAALLVSRRGRLGGYAAGMERAALAALARGARELGLDARHEISVVFCDNRTIRAVNRRWRGKDAATDVLSFPLHAMKAGGVPPAGALGDIMISLPTARRGAKAWGVDAEAHVGHLAVHGLLHLLGHDHCGDREARRMEREEERLLGRGRRVEKKEKGMNEK